VDAVVPRRVTVREVGQLVDGRVQHARLGRRARLPQADHRVAGRQPLVHVGRVEPVHQATREPPSHVRPGLVAVEGQPVHERPERLVRHGRLPELECRGLCGRQVLCGATEDAAAVKGALVVVGRHVRRRRQRPEHVGREHFRDGRVHFRRIFW